MRIEAPADMTSLRLCSPSEAHEPPALPLAVSFSGRWGDQDLALPRRAAARDTDCMLVRLLSLIAAVVLACASAPTRGNASWTQSEAAHRYFAASITNSRGLQTEIDFMVYDEASEELPLAIRAPEGMMITFDRDADGKPQSITRSGTSPAVSATRRLRLRCQPAPMHVLAEIDQEDESWRGWN
ncbi:MAG: hypothetical protein IPG63_18470 [Xanthomonadales bacterium]|nr:hypothetical protein [Xanthomonadales bacterium]